MHAPTKRQRVGAGQRTTGVVVVGVLASEYGKGGEATKQKRKREEEEAAQAYLAKQKRAIASKEKLQRAMASYGDRIVGGPRMLTKVELVAALKARGIGHVVRAQDRVDNKLGPKEILVRRLECALEGGRSRLRAVLCEDCNIVEATMTLASSQAIERVEPSWCHGCSDTHRSHGEVIEA